RASGAGTLEMDIDDPALEAAKDDVAAVLGHRRAYAGVEQLLDLRDDLGVLLAALRGCRQALRKDRPVGNEVFHDDAEQGRFQKIPLLVGPLGHRDEIAAKEDPGDPLDLKQAF